MASFFDRNFIPAPTGITGHDFDRADELRRDDQALFAARLHPGARWLLLDEMKPHITPNGRLHWSRKSDVAPDSEIIFLGFEGGEPRFAAIGQVDPDDEVQLEEARAAAMRLSGRDAAILAQARSLIHWHAKHRFCGECGAPTENSRAGHARICAGCRQEHFPRTDPVVIMLALHGEGDSQRALLGRQPAFPDKFMSALAGFVEHGESIEEAVRRELLEEAGIMTSRVAYVSSQPWPFPYSLMMGAFAEADTDELSIDNEELESAAWYTRSQVAAALDGDGEFFTPPPFAIAHTLLKTWVDNR